ncbi:uncharacterized protein LOC113869295 [Abrus precatorius]|uniref:Uncharacterized protein LOC113869295 n=1 Tax=Abrus precatorius TaxID=3816 RepID=A0A8B8LYM3_ABRPR|nr:uncharacterized protein LOC113869295 [Abrus precatorius]
METPSSTRRVTRSQTLAASNDALTNSNRSALIDITNDSPIVGLANGVLNLETPLAKQRGSRVKKTPGSGEALLRGQVKTLLQKVEEEAEFSKISLESMPFFEPTPANAPQIQSLSGLVSVTPYVVLRQPLISQVVNQGLVGKNQEKSEPEKSPINRSLLLDFSDKSQSSDASEERSSELGYEERVQGEKDPTATTEDDDGDEEVAEDYYEDEYDELCKGLNNISMNERMAPKFAGKHTRFVYNSDDELVEEEVEENNSVQSASPNILRLEGLPTPKGKHLRFSEEEISAL